MVQILELHFSFQGDLYHAIKLLCDKVAFPSHCRAGFWLASESEQLWACCTKTGKQTPSSSWGEELLCWSCHEEPLQLKRMTGQSTWSNAVLPLGGSLLLAGWICFLSSCIPRAVLWWATVKESTCPKETSSCAQLNHEKEDLFVPFLQAWSHSCQFYFALCDTCTGIDKYWILLMVEERAENSLLYAREQGVRVVGRWNKSCAYWSSQGKVATGISNVTSWESLQHSVHLWGTLVVEERGNFCAESEDDSLISCIS